MKQSSCKSQVDAAVTTAVRHARCLLAATRLSSSPLHRTNSLDARNPFGTPHITAIYERPPS